MTPQEHQQICELLIRMLESAPTGVTNVYVWMNPDDGVFQAGYGVPPQLVGYTVTETPTPTPTPSPPLFYDSD